jgi:hypothetical protein
MCVTTQAHIHTRAHTPQLETEELAILKSMLRHTHLR